MDALDDIRRLIAETEQEVKKTSARRCWGFHAWEPWIDFALHQERHCARCGKVQLTRPRKCEHPVWEAQALHGISPNGMLIGHIAYQECTTCGKGRSVQTFVTDNH